jgi:putative addiction module CopG family antidote
MSITLTAEIEGLVNEQLATGAFHSVDEVILLSLRLLKEQQAKQAELRRLMETAREDIAQGRYTVCQTDEELDAFIDKITQQEQEHSTQAGGQ